MNIRASAAALFILSCLMSPSALSLKTEIHGLLEGGLVGARYGEPWLNSWMDGGVGVLRYQREDRWEITQGLLDAQIELTSTLNANISASYYPDGDRSFGLSEAYLHYRPLAKNWRPRVKAGLFYPHFSLENVDIGWSSPYTQSFSAINSWIAEELRVAGTELSLSLPGRPRRSPHTWTLSAAFYKGNDPIGTLLSWRGWALHNRQTRLGESVRFADYFQFQPMAEEFPTQVDVIEETDGRWGFYVGGHWRFQQSTDVRLYYYDNQADPLSEEVNRQYGWETRFTSLALKHRRGAWTLLMQAMTGSSRMGHLDEGGGVDINFGSAYALISRKVGQHRFSLRYDYFEVTDEDRNPYDPNRSRGNGVTAAWHYQWSPHWQFRGEYISLDSDNDNRTLWRGWAAQHRQQQWVGLIQYRF